MKAVAKTSLGANPLSLGPAELGTQVPRHPGTAASPPLALPHRYTRPFVISGSFCIVLKTE